MAQMTTEIENTTEEYNPFVNPDEERTEQQIKEHKAEVLDKIIVARVGLLLRHPFFGNMATRLKIEENNDWCHTAATDGRGLYYNRHFFDQLTPKQIEFVLAHEILHNVYDHMTRREGRDPQIHNIAADYCVNGTLIREKIGDPVTQIKFFHDFKYEGWSSEEVYDDIFEKYDEEQLKQLGELLDDHVDWEKGTGNNKGNGSNGENKKEDKKGPPKYSKDELRKIRDEIKESMIGAAQAAGAGNVPAGVERMIKDLTEPKMNWREILRQQIQSAIKSDYSFMRPSRNGWHTGAILPGNDFEESIDLAVALDMSGSIGEDQARDFLSEIKGIMDEYQDYKIKVWCFDTAVYNEQDFSADNGSDIENYEIIGGGGTDFMCNWDYMKEQDYVPKKFIMFTDGYAWDSWGDPDYCDTIFVIHSNRNKDLEGPFGYTTHYENQKKAS
jgi:predicted metal-dependent peptidase